MQLMPPTILGFVHWGGSSTQKIIMMKMQQLQTVHWCFCEKWRTNMKQKKNEHETYRLHLQHGHILSIQVQFFGSKYFYTSRRAASKDGFIFFGRRTNIESKGKESGPAPLLIQRWRVFGKGHFRTLEQSKLTKSSHIHLPH